MKQIRATITLLRCGVALLGGLLFCALPASAAALEGRDAGRILMLRQKVGRYPAGAFCVFTALDENDTPLCEPLSGGSRREKIGFASYERTPYFRDTPAYEILLDIGEIYSDAQFFRSVRLQENYQLRCRLLKVLGKQEMMTLLLELDEILQRYRRSFREGRKKFLELAEEKNPDEDAINDGLKDLGTILEQRLTGALAKVTQALNRDDSLLAVAAYLHIRNFFLELHSGESGGLYFRGKNGLGELQQVAGDLFRQCENNILTFLARRYRDQPRVKEFRALFPKSRGMWSESPPANLKQLQEYSRTFYRCRKEEKEYAPVADFEQWGNCRLSLLLGCSAGKESAYLEQEFQAALQKYQRFFHHH